MDLNTILKTCFTKQQALRKLEEMKEAQNKKDFTIGVARDEAPASWRAVERQYPASEIRSMESLTIFTAIPLPEEQIPILGAFVRKTFPQIKFIDLKVDPNLIGGASFGWKGEYKDYSLRKAVSCQSSAFRLSDD